MKSLKKYKAFSLFEILIAIVVLGVVLAAFPAFFTSSINTAKISLKEEIFFQEAAILDMINQRYFDENNTIGSNFYKDLNASSGDDELLNNYYANFVGECRIGKSFFNNNEFRSGSSDDVSKIGLDDGESEGDYTTYDDIDDFNGYSESFLNNDIYVNVKYVNDSATYSDQNISFSINYSSTATNTNIKLITVWSKVADTNLTLRYPACNIGASKFLSLEEISR